MSRTFHRINYLEVGIPVAVKRLSAGTSPTKHKRLRPGSYLEHSLGFQKTGDSLTVASASAELKGLLVRIIFKNFLII